MDIGRSARCKMIYLIRGQRMVDCQSRNFLHLISLNFSYTISLLLILSLLFSYQFLNLIYPSIHKYIPSMVDDLQSAFMYCIYIYMDERPTIHPKRIFAYLLYMNIYIEWTTRNPSCKMYRIYVEWTTWNSPNTRYIINMYKWWLTRNPPSKDPP